MKKTFFVLFMLAMAVSFSGVAMAAGPNLLTNGDFSSGTSSWGLINNSAVVFSTTEGVAAVSITNPGNTYLQNTGQFTLEAGKTYRITFDAWSTNGNNLKVFVYKANTGTRYTHPTPDESFNLGTDWLTFNYDFVPNISGTVSDALLAFDLREDVAGMQYFFDNVKITSLNDSIPPQPTTTVKGTVYASNGIDVVADATVDVDCNGNLKGTTSDSLGAYSVEYFTVDCMDGDFATVTATFDGLSGTNSTTLVCENDECIVTVALEDTSIPEFTTIGAAVALLAVAGIFIFRRK